MPNGWDYENVRAVATVTPTVLHTCAYLIAPLGALLLDTDAPCAVMPRYGPDYYAKPD